MSEDTLNEKLRYAIETNADASFSTMGVDGISEAANECERICIQSQIDLLNKIDNDISDTMQQLLWKEVQSLTNKLNSLK